MAYLRWNISKDPGWDISKVGYVIPASVIQDLQNEQPK